MKDKDVYDEISSIKNMMERSTRFISLSGLSGVMAGVYALVGAGVAYMIIPIYLDRNFYEVLVNHNTSIGLFYGGPGFADIKIGFLVCGLAVLIPSLLTGVWLTTRKARRSGKSVWNQSSRAMLNAGLIPLLTGGCFILILLFKEYYGFIAPACLIFYGLALYAASQYTFGDVKWLGISEIVLGLIALMLPYYGLIFWALGFGVLHILYGTFMYFKYDRENSAD